MMNESSSQGSHYQIEVEGYLDQRWQSWFEEFVLSHNAAGNTLLCGPVRDQAALHGVLKRINNLGLRLLSLRIRADGPNLSIS